MGQEVSSTGLLTSNLQTTAWPCRGANCCRAPERLVVWLRLEDSLVPFISNKMPGLPAPRRVTPDRPASASHHRIWLRVRMMNKCQRYKGEDVTHTHTFSHTDQVVLIRLQTEQQPVVITCQSTFLSKPRPQPCVTPLNLTGGLLDLSPPPRIHSVTCFFNPFHKTKKKNREDFRYFLKTPDQAV